MSVNCEKCGKVIIGDIFVHEGRDLCGDCEHDMVESDWEANPEYPYDC